MHPKLIGLPIIINRNYQSTQSTPHKYILIYNISLSLMSSLQTKFDQDASFKTQMLRAEKNYHSKLQIAIYSDLSKVCSNMVKHAGVDENGNQLFFVFGMLQANDNLDKMHLYLADWFEHHIPEKQLIQQDRKEGFVIVYFNSHSDSYSAYTNFRNIYRTFPMKYFTGLKRFIIVHPSFAIKALDWMVSGTVNKYLKDQTEYASTILKLKEFSIPLSKEIMDCIREDIRVIDFPKGMTAGVSTIKDPKKKKIFDQKLEPPSLSEGLSIPKPDNPTKLMAKKLEQYEMSEIGVPVILKLMIMYLKIRPDFLNEEGIFRKSVAIDEEYDAITELYSGNLNYIQNITNPHLVASLIKKMLSHLSQPLFPYTLYKKFTNDQGQNTNLDYLKTTVHQLPHPNYITLQFLLEFFVTQIIPRSNSNKMSYYNVAVVLMPSLLRSSNSSIQDLMYSKKLAFVLESILKNFDYIFGGKEELEDVYRQSQRASQDKFNQQTLKLEF